MAKKTIRVTMNRQNIAKSNRRIIYAVIIKLQKNYKLKPANINLASVKTKSINPPGFLGPTEQQEYFPPGEQGDFIPKIRLFHGIKPPCSPSLNLLLY
jgi:hypothetical protein